LFITRASRHDKADLLEFYESQDWHDVDIDEGTFFMARDGQIVAGLRLVEVAPQTVVVEDVVVRDGRRREGIGTRLMQAAMNSRGGTLYLSTHDAERAFYLPFGFDEIDIPEAPEEVVEFWRKAGDYPTEEGHVHHYMKAR
jgi:N-acetylglutamate synthase-like GNAT family acetyltransferase